MKKLFFVALVSFGFLLLLSSHASAASCTIQANKCDESCVGGTLQANGITTGGTTSGLVPCGKSFGQQYKCLTGVAGGPNANLQNVGTVRAQSLDLATALCKTTFPAIANDNTARGELVVNAQTGVADPPTFACRCELYHTFILGKNVYIFIIWDLAAPLAGLLIIFGGVLLLLSGASTKLHDLAKHMLWGAVWGMALILGAYLIVNIVLIALGQGSTWNVF